MGYLSASEAILAALILLGLAAMWWLTTMLPRWEANALENGDRRRERLFARLNLIWLILVGIGFVYLVPKFTDDPDEYYAGIIGVAIFIAICLSIIGVRNWISEKTKKPNQISISTKRKNTPAVKLAIQAIDLLSSQHSNQYVTWDSIGKKAKIRIKNEPDKTHASLMIDGMTPISLGYLLISNIAYHEILYGSSFIYRGILSQSGREALAIFKLCNVKLVELGEITEDEYVADLSELDSIIKEMG